MAIRTYKVTLDSKNAIAPEPVFLRQGDKTGAVVIDATLMDNGAPVSLDGLTPIFKANTADGQAVIVDSTGFSILDSANGEFTYQVPNALSAVPGKIMTAYFSLSDASGSESTFDVVFIIKKAVDITQAQADDYITIIDGTLQSLQQKIDAMNTDVQTILNAFNQGNLVSIATDQTISGAKTFTAPINGALATRAATFTDFATVAANMNTYAGNWYVADTTIANSPVADMTLYVVEVIPGDGTADGTIRVNKYDSGNSYFNIPNSGVLGTWHRVATDADVTTINSNISGLVTDTNWQSTGITMLNGWLADTFNPIQYRTITIGGLMLIEISGWASGPAMVQSASAYICTLPDTITKYFSDSNYNVKGLIGQSTVRKINGIASVSDGKLRFVIYGQNALSAGDGFWINILYIVAPKQ
jgi:hypothetical protein